MLVTIYQYWKNNSLENIFYLVPFFLFILLTSAVLSYMTLIKTLNDEAHLARPGLLISLYTIVMLVAVPLVIIIFVRFQIHDAYIWLPIVIAGIGSLAFSIIAKFLKHK